MAEAICKVLRDGALEGELAPALLIKDTVTSPLGDHVFEFVVSQLSSYILAGKAQSRGLVIVALSKSPSFYIDLLRKSGFDDVALDKRIRILDCYSDPLGWKHRLKESQQISSCPESSSRVTVFRDVRNLEKLLSSMLELGKGLVGQGKDQFCIAIDSVTGLLREVSLSSVAGLLSDIRSNGQVSSTVWLLHSDVHNASTNAALEYMCSILAGIEGATTQQSISMLEKNVSKAKLRIRLKRRNGRVRLMSEEIHVEFSGVVFSPLSEDDSMVQSLMPKVQFNLQLSEKEQLDRSKVVLPFEHQEKERAKQIYDGRRSHVEGQNEMGVVAGKIPATEHSRSGQIVYFRDSDDERPDSDEDPDDDLDI